MPSDLPSVSIVIPTYNREAVLLDTLQQLLELEFPASEILVIDQTETHLPETEKNLKKLDEDHAIRWLRSEEPSIPRAMNRGLLSATGEIVLFLDDDIELNSNLVQEHAREYSDPTVHAVVGQVIQSWEQALEASEPGYPRGKEDDPDAFRFNSANRCEVQRVMAGNLSVRKEEALQMGGFDENFVRVAYRFESEFADRFVAHGFSIIYQPRASIRHLKVAQGGTREFGEHLTTIRPAHSVGRYYYMLVARRVPGRVGKFLYSPFRAVATRFHLRHPWWIPVTFTAEIGGMIWAVLLWRNGQKIIDLTQPDTKNAV